FDRHPVRARRAAITLGLDLTREIDRSTEQQQLLGQRRLAGVRMGNDRERASSIDLRGKWGHRNRIGTDQGLVHRLHVAAKSSKIKPSRSGMPAALRRFISCHREVSAAL